MQLSNCHMKGRRTFVLVVVALVSVMVLSTVSASDAEYADSSVFSVTLDAHGQPTYAGTATLDSGFDIDKVTITFYSDKKCTEPIVIAEAEPGAYWVVATTVGLKEMADVSSEPIEFLLAPAEFELPTEDSMMYIAITIMLSIVLIGVFIAVHMRAAA